MLDSNILKKLQEASIEERIQLIEAILQTLKHDLNERSRPSDNSNRSLRGKVRRYENPI